MDVVIVGAGRLGRSLAALLPAQGHRVTLVGRGPVPTGELILITVPDRAIPDVVPHLPAGVPAAHCAGSLGPEALWPHRPAGALHPLMSFPGPEVGLPPLQGVGAAISGDPEVVVLAERLAVGLGMVPFPAPADRALYHAAAVMAGNYATVLLAEATRMLAAAGVPNGAALLAPLARQSLAAAVPDPAAALTGPAARGDLPTLARHRAALHAAGLHDLVPLYDLLAEHAATTAHPPTIRES